MRVLMQRTAIATLTAVLATSAAAAEKPLTLDNGQLAVTVDPQIGTVSVLDKRISQRWFPDVARKSGGPPRFRHLQRLPGKAQAISFEADFGTTDKRPNTLQVTLRLSEQGGDLAVEADMARRDTPIKPFAFLDPLVTDSDRAAIVVADYSNGHLYPANVKTPVRSYFAASRLDMPWIGVCDLRRGSGYMLLVETSDDGFVSCHSQAAGRDFAAPQVDWAACKGQFAYPRKLLYHFVSCGGYVALAKRYRQYAADQGLLVTLAEKVKKNPNLRRLFGAPDIWGDDSLAFAQEAKAAGVEKMLIHGRASPADMKAINDLGYLTSEYDNYTDVFPVGSGQTVDSSHDRVPENVVLKVDSQRMKAWLTFDKKQQYMKRCPAQWVATARLVVPKLLRTYPYLGRFIDVTTAEDLYECYDPNHPLTRGQKRQCGVDLLAFIRSQGLVVGGEHGIWWGVPQQDYIEGMMSASFASWPAGHLIHPKTKHDSFEMPSGGKAGKWESYEQWGIGHEARVPLWELVFHDCVVSTWYWGDASDFLLDAAPEITPKKDAFNVLYGTIPLMWANREGAWHNARDVFLRTYRNTCKLHEAIAGAEMLSHEWLTPDRAVQRTRFSDGTEVAVNFGPQPQIATIGGRNYLLPQNGWAVKGPKIEQSLALDGSLPVTTIRTPDYLFSDAAGAAMALRRKGSERVLIEIGAGRKPALLPLAMLVSNWDTRSTRLYQLDGQGRRTKLLAPRQRKGRLEIGPFAAETAVEALCGAQVAMPDLCFDPSSLTATPQRPKQGEPLNLAVTVCNRGGAAAAGVEVACYADRVEPAFKLTAQTVTLAAGAIRPLRLSIDTAALDGTRDLIVVVNPEATIKELCTANNRAVRTIDVAADYSTWPHRRRLIVEAGALARDEEPIVVPADLPGADPDSVRVVQCGAAGELKAAVPAQLDVLAAGRSELCLLLKGKTPPGAVRPFMVLWADRPVPGKRRAVLPPLAWMWQPESSTINAETYRVRLENGALVDLAAQHKGQADAPFISKLILSSQATGWNSEPGTLERCQVLAAGPVRTVIAVRKSLHAGVVYEKTYGFYPRRFELSASVNKRILLSRAYYLQQGQYVDNAGSRAMVDGQGNDEGVVGRNRRPRWYAVYADRWAHSCVALSPFQSLTYWDAPGGWGGIGLQCESLEGVRMGYVIHPGAQDAAFAEDDYRQLTAPPQTRWE